MRKALALTSLFAGAALALLATGCGDAPSKADCEKLLDHTIELQLKETGGDRSSADSKVDIDAQKKEVRASIEKSMMEECMNNLPGSQVKCALKAKNMQEIAACEAE